jgi:hypothetical protein
LRVKNRDRRVKSRKSPPRQSSPYTNERAISATTKLFNQATIKGGPLWIRVGHGRHGRNGLLHLGGKFVVAGAQQDQFPIPVIRQPGVQPPMGWREIGQDFDGLILKVQIQPEGLVTPTAAFESVENRVMTAFEPVQGAPGLVMTARCGAQVGLGRTVGAALVEAQAPAGQADLAQALDRPQALGQASGVEIGTVGEVEDRGQGLGVRDQGQTRPRGRNRRSWRFNA